MKNGYRRLMGWSLIAASSAWFVSCGQPAPQPPTEAAEIDPHPAAESTMARQLAADTEFLNEIIRTLNALSQAQSETQFVSSEVREVAVNLTIDQKELIRRRLETIADELHARGKEIARLREKRSQSLATVKAPDEVIEQYESLIKNLQDLVEAKEAEIKQTRQSLAASETRQADLRGDLRECQERNDTLASNQAYEQERWQRELEAALKEIAALRRQAAEGFVAIGSEKELRAKGLIQVKHVGFLKTGRVVEVARDLDPGRFERINTLAVNPIPLGSGKGFEILTPHKRGCYDLPVSQDKESYLNISDIPCFWENKFLIVLKE